MNYELKNKTFPLPDYRQQALDLSKVASGSIPEIKEALEKAYTEGHKDGWAHCGAEMIHMIHITHAEHKE